MVARGLRLTVLGLVIGLGGAAALTRFLEKFLFGVQPIDPLTFGLVSGLLAASALLAAYLPARRAARLNPSVALRHE